MNITINPFMCQQLTIVGPQYAFVFGALFGGLIIFIAFIVRSWLE